MSRRTSENRCSSEPVPKLWSRAESRRYRKGSQLWERGRSKERSSIACYVIMHADSVGKVRVRLPSAPPRADPCSRTSAGFKVIIVLSEVFGIDGRVLLLSYSGMSNSEGCSFHNAADSVLTLGLMCYSELPITRNASKPNFRIS
jgi:hypothetical protein